MSLFRGLADDLPLEDWLNHYIFPAESSASTAILSIGAPGWRWPRCCFPAPPPSPTCICLPTQVARAAAETGIRAVVGEVLYDFPSPNYGPPAAGLKFSEDLCRAWRDHPLIRVAIQPHAVYTCSPELLLQCGELAEKYDTPALLSTLPRQFGR